MNVSADRIPDFDFSASLPVGAMLPKDGTTTKMPFPLPDLDVTEGAAWVVESGPGILRFREHLSHWGRVPVEWHTTVRRLDDATVSVSFVADVLGKVKLPSVETKYRLLDAGRGWLELESKDTDKTTPDHLRTSSGSYDIDMTGSGGFHDRKTLQVILPGETGYVAPPWSTGTQEVGS